MDGEFISLKWNNHQSTFLHFIKYLRSRNLNTDVTLACKGKFFHVHKFVLSICSDYFNDIFNQISCTCPIIVLNDINYKNLEYLLDYMYTGEVNVKQNELASLVSMAEVLKIKGLAVSEDFLSKSSRNLKVNPEKDLERPSINSIEKEKLSPSHSQPVSRSSNTSIMSGVLSNEEDPILEPSPPKVDIKVKEEPVESMLYVNDKDSISCVNGRNGNSLQSPPNETSILNEFPQFTDTNELLLNNSDFSSENYQQEICEPASKLNFNFPTNNENDLRRNLHSNHLGFTSDGPNQVSPKKIFTYICPHCSYGSHDKSNFKRHVQTHTGEKPYQCPFCSHRSIHSSNLRCHIFNKHRRRMSSQSLKIKDRSSIHP